MAKETLSPTEAQNAQKAKKLVDELFSKLENGEKIENIRENFTKEKFALGKFNSDKYPEIKFTITPTEIQKLQKAGILSEDHKINAQKITDPLSKILFSIIWKNGDLGKEANLIKGILPEPLDDSDDYLVFYQFGKHLKNLDEPIIDQHVLRCYLIHKTDKKNIIDISKYLKLKIITKEYQKHINSYTNWIKLRVKAGYEMKNIDEILFLFGKKLKEYAKTEKVKKQEK